jgi:hypothetical protein
VRNSRGRFSEVNRLCCHVSFVAPRNYAPRTSLFRMPGMTVLVGRFFSLRNDYNHSKQALRVVHLSHEFLEMHGRWFGGKHSSVILQFSRENKGNPF